MPSDWKTIRLGEVCSKIGSGATPRGGSKVYLESGECALIRSQNVYNDGFTPSGLAYIEPEHANQLSNVEVQSRDVLLNITGDSVARCCQVIDNILPARVNQHVAIIRPDPARLNPEYLRYYLISPQMQVKMLSWAGAGGTRNALTKGMIESFDIPALDIKEQYAIAHILGTLDDKIELLRRMNETLEAMARAIFKSWFVDFDPVRAKAEGRKPPGMSEEIAKPFPDSFEDSELGEMPKGWKTAKIGDVCDFAYGKALKASNRKQGDIPVYGSNGQVGWHNEKLVDGPGIVVGRKGNPGIIKWVQSDFWPIDTTFYIVRHKSGLSLNYLFYALEKADLPSLAADSAVPGLNRNMAYMTDVVVPSKEILEAFDKYLDTVRKKVYSGEEQSRALASIRDALLPKLLSGEIRVKDAEKLVE